MRTRIDMGDWQRVQAYAKGGSEAAFAELVRLHIDWVYSVALRHVGDPHLAEDVVQSVFVLLARKACDLRPGTLLGGWLFRTTRHVAAHARRTEQRRKSREATVSTMSHDPASPDSDPVLWEQLVPHLEQAVAALSPADRAAILPRFYQKMTFREVGETLGISEDAAKKRVSRAVEKLREFLDRRGVKLTSAVLMALLAEHTVQPASAAMAGTVVKVSMAAASASAPALLPLLARETLRAWDWAKVKLAAGFATASLALILVVLNSNRSPTRQAWSESASVNPAPRADASTLATDPAAVSALVPENKTEVPRKTGAVTGLVTDEQGIPIADAKVWGGYGGQPFAQDTTDSSGQFALDTLAAPPLVTVTADGYAADQQQVDPANIPGTLVFRLSPVRPLEVRLVDQAGSGVPGARLFLQEWWGRAGTLGQHLDGKTDANGRLKWSSPPKGELQLSFSRAGYRYSRSNKFAADGEIHTIVLHPLVTVRGNVTDADTGRPVAAFKLTLGHAQPWVPSDPVPMWDFQGRNCSNGVYSAVIEEEQVPHIRIEAVGYETVETEIQLTNGVEAVRDFQLNPVSVARSIRGTVFLPDGQPAPGVEVALCTANVGVMLSGTTFEPGAFGNINRSQRYEYRRKTDDAGAFSFDPKPGAHTLVAVGPAGLGQTRCFDFSKPLEIRLQSWGRIEGIVRTRDGQWAGRKVQWHRTGILTSWMTLFCKAEGFSGSSDTTGTFTVEHVPPGDGRLAIDDSPGTAPILSPSIHVEPGETVSVQIGGIGSAVTGRLVAPPGVEIRSWSNQVHFARLKLDWDSYEMPKELSGSAAERWKLEFEDTGRGRAWFRRQYEYDFRVGVDGSFAIPEVLPGRYTLSISVAQGYLGSGSDGSDRSPVGPQIAYTAMKVSVPDASAESGAPVELGELILTATH